MAKKGNAIVYSLVARETVILAEFAAGTGNFASVTRKILEKIPGSDSRMSYVCDRHIFHIMVFDGLTYMCMAEEDFGRRAAFSFLEDIKNKFSTTYGERGRTALAYSMNEDFSRVLSKQMDHYSASGDNDKIERVKADMDDVKNVMVDNIEKVLKRGEKIELLVDKTDNLNQQSIRFKKHSSQLKTAMWWQNARLMIFVGAVVVVVALIAYYSMKK
uniref:V-SNARE coiled-coil homology domain-containing protein n=1 Tax=Hemiselmis andersenii TaxID=464988 RepID=A0A6U4MYF0_HEMAN